MPIINQQPLIIPNPDLKIWRYIDLNKFENLLKEKSLFFCRADKFSDPFEGSLTKRESEHRIKDGKRIANFHNRPITHEEAVTRAQKLGEFQKKFNRSFVVNCWHINQGESDAMWRLYLKTNEGVAIQTTVGNLRKSFDSFDEEMFITKVRYLDYENQIWFDANEYPETSYNLFTPIVHKRKAFVHESELRIFQQVNDAVANDNYWDDQPNYMGKLIPCNVEQLIERIIIPPTSDDPVKNKVEDLLKTYGLDKEIMKSKLNEEPYY